MAKIGIITRVHASRQGLLGRAAASLLAQSWQDWEWVLVAHGAAAELQAVVAGLGPELARRARVIDSGLGADQFANGRLLNLGLATLETEFVACLDEDDTWEPEALARLLAALEGCGFESVGAAVCQSRKIVEVTQDEGWPLELEREDLNPKLTAVTLTELALENRFTNHALLLRRALAQQLGGWNEALPLFVDWEFNLRLLDLCDVVVLPEVLANYHQRQGGEGGLGNISFATQGNRRETARAAIINGILRDPGSSPGLRAAVAAAAGNFELREEVRRCWRRLEVISERVGRIDSRSKQLKDKLL